MSTISPLMTAVRCARQQLLLVAACSLAAGGHVQAQSSPHLGTTVTGGMPGMPVMTGITRVTNGVKVTWDGPSGYYQLLQKLGLKGSTWQAVGTPFNLARNATITTLASNAFFRVAGPSPQYAGAQTCIECHGGVYNEVVHTAHLGAFSDPLFVTRGGQTNSSCLPCHTVGYKLPTGFISQAATPALAGAQCESCHGPAGNHAANPDDPTAIPRIELAATMCGGCHNAQAIPAAAVDLHPPYYEEWNASPHRDVLPDLKADFAGSSGPTVFIPTCGRCHSGTVREALLENDPLPNGQEAGAIGIACATCHDAHSQSTFANVLNGVFTFTNTLTGVGTVIRNTELGAVYTNQLRSPLGSLLDYHAAGSFATNYNPNINICAQCHNDRGASWTTTDRPPHNSLQYNMLLGTVGVLTNGLPPNLPATHAMFEKQCVRCHMQTTNYVSGAQPPTAGHTFTVDVFNTCLACHPFRPDLLVQLTQVGTSNQIQQVKHGLDFWASTKAPAQLQKYGTLAWEYYNAGPLSSPNGTLRGPLAAPTDLTKDEQHFIPANIQKARFNLYLVQNDGSLGVHNGWFAVDLLNNAASMVQAELDK